MHTPLTPTVRLTQNCHLWHYESSTDVDVGVNKAALGQTMIVLYGVLCEQSLFWGAAMGKVTLIMEKIAMLLHST